jgi:hypothetical protein
MARHVKFVILEFLFLLQFLHDTVSTAEVIQYGIRNDWMNMTCRAHEHGENCCAYFKASPRDFTVKPNENDIKCHFLRRNSKWKDSNTKSCDYHQTVTFSFLGDEDKFDNSAPYHAKL